MSFLSGKGEEWEYCVIPYNQDQQEIWDVIGGFYAIVFYVSFFQVAIVEGEYPAAHSGLGILVESPCLKACTAQPGVVITEKRNILCLAFLSLALPMDLNATTPEAKGSCATWKDKTS